MNRVRFWKDRFAACWQCGDRKGMAEAEKMIEAWRLAEAEQIPIHDTEEVEAEQQAAK